MNPKPGLARAEPHVPELSLGSMQRTYARLIEQLLAARSDTGHWEGDLSSSALSTATAVVALAVANQKGDDRELVNRGLQWLARRQNSDGGWGDTTRSLSNISTTALCWAAFAFRPPSSPDVAGVVTRCEGWLSQAAGSLHPEQLRQAIAARYGKDRTFSAPIMMTLALSGRLGEGAWKLVPQLPFELAACPPSWFQRLQLPVVSYALPALIAIGQARHHYCPSRNRPLRAIRDRLRAKTSRVLRRIQPSTGGYLEATPLTSFVVMSLAGIQRADSDVARDGLRFLRASIRDDGSWPIDTNLATWVTTLSINALAAGPEYSGALSREDRASLSAWLLDQQHVTVHPYTQAPPGGWAWTPLAGGVPDADDTSGALLALKNLGVADSRVAAAVSLGVGWLLNLQNRDGGIPTFCKGWGALPFDRSAPDLTAHALLAWSTWLQDLPESQNARARAAIPRALAYLASVQRADGAWVPLWFGNQHAADDVNATYGTARVILALAQLDAAAERDMTSSGVRWLMAAQNGDGGWGGDVRVTSSIEETSVTIEALAARAAQSRAEAASLRECVNRGLAWLVSATEEGTTAVASPVGLYFAKLWYYETLYPFIFSVSAIGRAISCANR
jgi:squalene-hopene/tetraprenyl-beta-curcumene cyclase